MGAQIAGKTRLPREPPYFDSMDEGVRSEHDGRQDDHECFTGRFTDRSSQLRQIDLGDQVMKRERQPASELH